MKKQRAPKRPSEAASTRGFSVRDYPFMFMHVIVTMNNRNIGEMLKPQKLSPSIWRILAILQERDGITISELAQQSLIERTLLGRILEGLEKRDFVQRRHDRGDKRRTVIFIRPAGIDTFRKILPIAREQIERAIEGLGKSELDLLQGLLGRISDNVSRRPRA